MSLGEQTTSLDVTRTPSRIVPLAELDTVNWQDLLSHEVVLTSGTLPSDASVNATLFTWVVSPSAFKSNTQKSIIMHLSEMFIHWHGTICFKLILTIPYFVATKIVFAYSPPPVPVENLSAATLAGLQNSVILNPVNNSEVVLRVPFISTQNWATTTGHTGSIAAKLLAPIVSSMQLAGGLPWTLMVSADISDFKFRYILPPPIGEAEPGTSNPQRGPTLGDATIARSMSTSGYTSSRTSKEWPLVRQSQAAPSVRYETLLLIPRSRVEFVMQKVRGQYPGSTSPSQVSQMFDIPAFTYNSYDVTSLPHPTTLYPYLDQNFIVSVGGHWFPDSENIVSPVAFNVAQEANTLWFQVPQSALNVLDKVKPGLFIVFMLDDTPQGSTTQAVYTYEGVFSNPNGTYWHGFRATQAFNLQLTTYSRAAVSWLGNQSNVTLINSFLRQIDDCPPEVTHMALYTTMPPELAAAFNEWLTTADNTSPPARALHYSISFSPNQSTLAFNQGRFSQPALEGKGIVWRLFKFFKGDETKWWAWLVKGLDIIVDALIGAFLGRASQPYVVPIGAGSGFRVEAVGDYDKDLISAYTERIPLEVISRIDTPRLVSVLAELQAPLRRHLRSKSRLAPKIRELQSVSSPQRMTSRSASARYRAKHPSPRKSFFRKSKSPKNTM
uniref:Capsid protein n=1 Tax=Crocidura shantungensis picorna-like virus 3 TaxID=3139523 RepID=A0AB38ZJZ1_9VIRU